MFFSCEYILLHERGYALDGSELNEVTHFHGHHTKRKYVSKTDRILLQFCYRSETFSGRNIQVQYRAIGMCDLILNLFVVIIVLFSLMS